MLLFEWNDVYGYLEHAEAVYEANGCTKRPKHRQYYGLWGMPDCCPSWCRLPVYWLNTPNVPQRYWALCLLHGFPSRSWGVVEVCSRASTALAVRATRTVLAKCRGPSSLQPKVGVLSMKAWIKSGQGIGMHFREMEVTLQCARVRVHDMCGEDGEGCKNCCTYRGSGC
jgi:hypothetical protein